MVNRKSLRGAIVRIAKGREVTEGNLGSPLFVIMRYE